MTTLTAASSHFAMQFGRDVILLIVCLPLAYYVVATLAGLRFFFRQREKSPGSFTPEVSVLKPVRGVDFASYENFTSFCLQDYPKYEILFCVNGLDDTAVPLIRRLAEEFPQRSIRLLSNAPQLGSNQKVNNLAMLASEAKYQLLVQSDGDVRVGPNYLREMAAPFERAETGVVSCFYRGVTQKKLWAEIEALGVATDFSAGVLVADWMEGVTFALGASVATTKTWLGKIGGYEGLANVLADDYEIGNRVAKAGGQVILSREVVETMYPAQTFAEFWAHQMRWARTVRLCRPASYVGLLFTQGLPLAIAGAIVSRSAVGALLFAAAYVGLRLAVAETVGVWGLRDETARRKWWLLPLRDLLQFAVWLASFFSNRIIWGNAEFELSANGEMAAIGKTDTKNDFRLFVLLAILLLPMSASAQHGTADNGYFPNGYIGDTWSGIVSSVAPATKEVSLVYTHHGKTAVFQGILSKGTRVQANGDKKKQQIVSEGISVGAHIRVYYMPNQTSNPFQRQLEEARAEWKHRKLRRTE